MIHVPAWLICESWRRLGSGQRLAACAIACGMAVVAALESVSIGLVFPLISLLAGGEVPEILTAAAAFTGVSLPSARTLALAILAILLVKSGLVVAVVSAQAAFLASIAREFGDRALSSHLAAPFEQHLQRDGADMTASVVGRLYTVLVFLYEPLFIIAAEALVAVAILAVLFAIEPVYSLPLFAAFAVLGVLGNTTLRRHAQNVGDVKETEHRRLIQTYAQTLGAIAEIHTANRSPYFRGLIREHLERYARAVGSERFILYMPRTFIEAGVAVLMFGGLALALDTRLSGSELVGLMGLFAAAAARLMPSASRLLHAVTMINLARDAFARLLPDLEPVPATAGSQHDGRGARRFERLQLTRVGYRYPSAAAHAIADVSVELRRGERILITGSSGSGKTTLLRLLVGLLAPTEGRITIDGKEIGANLRQLRELVGFVPQDPALVEDTLRANIVFGWDSGDEARLHRVVRLSHLETVIADLPAGLDTALGTSGIRLSRGQLQRIAIARALYREPKILIMDEPTASLDSRTEADVSDALEQLDDDVTILVVSHRPSVMRSCGRGIAIEGGRIVSDEAAAGPAGVAEAALALDSLPEQT